MTMTETDTHPGWLTVAEVAERLGIEESTWRAYVARGQAPAAESKIGPLPVWRTETIDAWLAERPGRGRWGRG